MDLNKHLVKNDDTKPFHSNGFAIVANGDRFGSTDNTSFEQRKQMSHNRKIITGYQRLEVADSLKINPVSRRTLGHGSIPERPPQLLSNSPIVPPRRFNESISKNQNPFT